MEKRFLLFGFGIVLAVVLAVFVFATTTFSVSPINYGNYSATLSFNVSTDTNGTDVEYNGTVFYNASGGNASVHWANLTNESVGGAEGSLNASLSITGLDDGAFYNFSVFVDNGTDQEVGSVYNVTIDNTGPNVTNFANTTAGGNYSDTINITVSVLDEYMNISTVWFNLTNESAQGQMNFTQASGDTTGTYFNLNLNVTAYPDGLYNITAYTNDSLTNTNNTESIQIRVDNSGVPNVTGFVNTVVYGNYTADTIILNVSVEDYFGVDEVWFNITNSTGEVNYTVASNPGETHYNISVNISSWPDGYYNISVHANDSSLAPNSNNTEYIRIIIDHTAPTSVTLTSTATARDSLSFSVAAADALTGVGTACTSSRSGVSLTGTATSLQTATESSLSCGTSYSYTITCSDLAGNSKSSAATSFTTSACIGSDPGTGGGGGGSSTTWSKTYVVTNEELIGGYNKELGSKNRAKVKVSGKTHYIGVKSLTASTATIEVTSTPQEVTMSVGEVKKFEVTDDGFYDLSVRLNSITGSMADVTILSIHEEVVEEPALAPEDNDTIEPVDQETATPTEGKSWTWLWIVIVILIIVVVIVIGKKKRK